MFLDVYLIVLRCVGKDFFFWGCPISFKTVGLLISLVTTVSRNVIRTRIRSSRGEGEYRSDRESSSPSYFFVVGRERSFKVSGPVNYFHRPLLFSRLTYLESRYTLIILTSTRAWDDTLITVSLTPVPGLKFGEGSPWQRLCICAERSIVSLR